MGSISKLFNLNDPGWGRGKSGGDSNGSEPPRRPQGNDNPPDLDEVWRDFNGKITNLFGRKGGGQGGRPGGSGSAGNGSPRGARVGLGVIVAAGLALWLGSGFYIVQEGYVGVVTQFGKYKATTPAGFQWRLPYPIQNHELVNVSQLRTFEIGFRGSSRSKVLPEALMLTDDENIIDMQFVVQYRLRGDGAPDYLFKTQDPDDSVRQAAETAMREVVGTKPMDFVLYEGRTEVAVEVQALMQQILDNYRAGIQISTVAIQNVQPQEQVQAAFDDAVKAGQDRERQINEGQAYANQVVPLASGQASRMLQQAEGYSARVIGDATGDAARFESILAQYNKAPDVMRNRLYLETMQEIFSRASKVMVDTEGGNNMIYLPLDKIMQQSAQEASRPTTNAPTVPPLPRVTQESNAAAGAAANTANTHSSGTLTRDRSAR